MEYKIKPWRHQLDAIERAGLLPGYALFFQMGTGKSGTVINILRHKVEAHGPQRILIFCPPIVVPNWREEWRMHSHMDMKKVVALVGPGDRRLKMFNQCRDYASVFITNYESLLMKPLFAAFELWEPQALVFDESHKCKSPEAKRSKQAALLANPRDGKVLKQKPFTYILSGSPILNSPMDIYQQFKILDGGESFGSNFWAFRAKYFRDRNANMPDGRYFPKWEVMTMAKDGVDALGEITELIFAKGMRVEKKECLDLPPEVSVIIKCAMTPEQARVYSELKKDYVTFFNSGACTASLAITKALRLMQITSGFIPVENLGGESTKHRLKDTPKLAALRELLEEITPNSKVLVWAVWKENYAQIRELCEELKIGFVEVHGEIGESQKFRNVERFHSDPEARVLVGHPGSGGIGINLTNAPYSIFYSRNFSLEHYLQARARNHRGGSKEAGHEKITHYDLVVSDTIDELAVKMLAQKLDMSDTLLKDLTKELMEQSN